MACSLSADDKAKQWVVLCPQLMEEFAELMTLPGNRDGFNDSQEPYNQKCVENGSVSRCAIKRMEYLRQATRSS